LIEESIHYGGRRDIHTEDKRWWRWLCSAVYFVLKYTMGVLWLPCRVNNFAIAVVGATEMLGRGICDEPTHVAFYFLSSC
jgi:hypothetical protein